MRFQLVSPYQPAGDQPRAIERLVDGIDRGLPHQVLLGVTGSGKTHTMARVIEATQRPTLVLAHNKTLAAQLYGEFKAYFPHNAVEYFVSYYDYYQPEAYVATSDTYIEKESDINDRLDRLRHSATRSLFERRDIIIVCSVSCIYGLGSSRAYLDAVVRLEPGARMKRSQLVRRLVDVLYERNDLSFHRGTFRVRGDTVEIFPSYEDAEAVRIEFWGDEIESIAQIDALRGTVIKSLDSVAIYPNNHYVTDQSDRTRAIAAIRTELDQRLVELRQDGLLLEAQRLEQRTLFDLESLEEMGHCSGIENYSRHLTGRAEGEPPPTLVEYFPDDFLLMVDESHQTIPQVGGMYRGDRARKDVLVRYGFRLPSARDNRPLRFDEFNQLLHQALYVSATPARYELEKADGVVVEQIIRPTGLLDPVCEVRPAKTQVDDLVGEIRATLKKGWRVLVTTLTKRMAEDLSEYLEQLKVKVRYLHSDVKTLQRIEIIEGLRRGESEVLVGVNLLREGLDLPEVALVAILDADKEGFLRNERSLIQTIGRAARNAEGKAILYADRVTDSMKAALDETARRRTIQEAWNTEHGVVPRTIVKQKSAMATLFPEEATRPKGARKMAAEEPVDYGVPPVAEIPRLVAGLRKEMFRLARDLEFEKAAALRDRIAKLEQLHLEMA